MESSVATSKPDTRATIKPTERSIIPVVIKSDVPSEMIHFFLDRIKYQ
jgi:hypothetical protein